MFVNGLWLDIDVPVCRDFILSEEQKLGRTMALDECLRLRV